MWWNAIPAVVVDAKTASNVQVLQLKALRPDLLDKIGHDDCSFPEDIHLHSQLRTLYGLGGSVAVSKSFDVADDTDRLTLVIVDPKCECTPTRFRRGSALIWSRNHCRHHIRFPKSHVALWLA